MDLQIPPEIEASLRQHAAAIGADVERYAIESIQDRLAAEANVKNQETPLSANAWKAEFRSWLSTFPKRRTRLDDSRDSIYEGRGE